jgi:hypothetical protein
MARFLAPWIDDHTPFEWSIGGKKFSVCYYMTTCARTVEILISRLATGTVTNGNCSLSLCLRLNYKATNFGNRIPVIPRCLAN